MSNEEMPKNRTVAKIVLGFILVAVFAAGFIVGGM